MKNKIQLCLCLLILLVSCKETVQRDYPLINTLEVTDISSKGVTFNAEVIDTYGTEIITSGFVWGNYSNLELSGSESVIHTDNLTKGTFKDEITYNIGNGIYYVRAFVQTDDYTVYGCSMQFVGEGSSAPVLVDFTPKEGSPGSYIKIVAKGLSNSRSLIKVMLNNFETSIVKNVADTVVVKIPNDLDFHEYTLKVSSYGQEAVFEDSFLVKFSY